MSIDFELLKLELSKASLRGCYLETIVHMWRDCDVYLSNDDDLQETRPYWGWGSL